MRKSYSIQAYLFVLTLATAFSSSAIAQGKMIFIRGGEFSMGSPASERQRNPDEKRHTVSVSDFYVDAYEVSQKDYERIMKKNPSVFKGGNLPVENVSYFDAIEYCNRLSESEGLQKSYEVSGMDVSWDRNANGYRLLTEAEWEYAARAGTSTIFNTGNWTNPKAINYEGSYPYLIEENYVHRTNKNVQIGENRGEPIAVDALAPNAWGLHHMHGNVSEWVFDFYGEYDSKNSKDPAGPDSGIYRVNRGGAYNDFGKHLRAAYRSATNPIDRDRNLGFRVARNAEKNPVGAKSVFKTKYDKKIAAIQIPKTPKILIPYFSYSGNTEKAAEYIAKTLKKKYGSANVEIVEIEMQNPYRGGIYEASQKDLMQNARPPLKTKIRDMAKYDVIVLGYPTWWATVPMPVLSFLESYDLSGKTVISFSSHGGTRFGDSVSDLNKSLQHSYVGIPFEFFYGGGRDLEKRIDGWLSQSGL